MNGLIRRRGMMGGKKEEYAVTAKESPQLMAMLYNLGWSASPDYMTISEANSITTQQFNNAFGRSGENISLFTMSEPFDGLKYFTGVTDFGYATFREAKLTHIIMPLTITTISKNNLFRNYKPSTKFTLEFPNIVSISGSFSFSKTNCDIVLGSNITSINGYEFINSQITAEFRPQILVVKASIPPTLNRGNLFATYTDLYVPDESVADYQADSAWSTFTNIYPISQCPLEL